LLLEKSTDVGEKEEGSRTDFSQANDPRLMIFKLPVLKINVLILTFVRVTRWAPSEVNFASKKP
jgi:hypothetical protein